MWLDDFRARVEAHPARTAVVARGQRYSYREMWERSAAAGRAASRADTHTRRLIALGDSHACLEAIIGAWIHDRVPLVVAPGLPSAAMDRVRMLVAGDPPRATRPEDREALVLGTSGSTGVPKLVALAQRSLNVALPAIAAWYDQPEDAQLLVPAAMHLARTLINNALLGLRYGWTVHLFPSGTPGSVLQPYIRDQGITVLNGPASLFRLFFRYGSSSTFPSLRHASSGGELVPAAVVNQIRHAFPLARTSITYGSTEAGTRISTISTDDPRSSSGAVGVPLSYISSRIVPVPGVEAPAGELWIRSPTVFLGYLHEDGSYAGLDAEGFLHTGDLVRADPDGCLHYLGRIGGLVKVGGLMVNPREVEQALHTMPGVADALCWAEPHDLLGYAIAAMVVPEPGAHLDERVLRRECHTRMEQHMVPRTLTIVDRLPENPSGKRSLMPAPANCRRRRAAALPPPHLAQHLLEHRQRAVDHLRLGAEGDAEVARPPEAAARHQQQPLLLRGPHERHVVGDG
jgi:acyl-CoA synthetase (AMP-forming)/AMP-acid ligase II